MRCKMPRVVSDMCIRGTEKRQGGWTAVAFQWKRKDIPVERAAGLLVLLAGGHKMAIDTLMWHFALKQRGLSLPFSRDLSRACPGN